MRIRRRWYCQARAQRQYTILGYDRSQWCLTANARQKSALRLLAASKETGYIDVAAADYVLDTTGLSRCSTRWRRARLSPSAVEKKIVMKGLQCRGNLQKWFDCEL